MRTNSNVYSRRKAFGFYKIWFFVSRKNFDLQKLLSRHKLDGHGRLQSGGNRLIDGPRNFFQIAIEVVLIYTNYFSIFILNPYYDFSTHIVGKRHNRFVKLLIG